MDEYNFKTQMTRLAACSPRSRDEEETARRTALSAELWRKYGQLTVDVWDKVISWVIEHHKAHCAPQFHQFTAALEAVRPSSSITDGPTHREWTATERRDWLVSEANHLGPVGARQVLRECESGRVQYDDEILQILLVRAGQPTNEEEFGPRNTREFLTEEAQRRMAASWKDGKELSLETPEEPAPTQEPIEPVNIEEIDVPF